MGREETPPPPPGTHLLALPPRPHPPGRPLLGFSIKNPPPPPPSASDSPFPSPEQKKKNPKRPPSIFHVGIGTLPTSYRSQKLPRLCRGVSEGSRPTPQEVNNGVSEDSPKALFLDNRFPAQRLLLSFGASDFKF